MQCSQRGISFISQVKKTEESLAQWAARVRSLASHCEFGICLEVAIRDKFIMGLEKGKVMNRLFSEDQNSLTFAKALELAQTTESAVLAFGVQDSSEQVGQHIKQEPRDLYKAVLDSTNPATEEDKVMVKIVRDVKCVVIMIISGQSVNLKINSAIIATRKDI